MSDVGATGEWQPHPWVANGGRGIRFGMGVTARAESRDWLTVLRLVATLDEIGVDSFWQPDHPAFTHDCWLTLAAAATHTRRLRLGPMVSCAGFRPPALTARSAADLDWMSGGRAVLALGAGWLEAEYPLLGLPFPPLRDRYQILRETIDVVQGLWASRPVLSKTPVPDADEVFPTVWSRQPFSYAGQFTQFKRAIQSYGPVQEPRVPLLIGGVGEKVTLRLVAEYADMANFEEMRAGTPEVVTHKLTVLRNHCADVGRPYESILTSYFLNGVLLAPTEERLAAKIAALPPLFGGSTSNGMTAADMIAKLRPFVGAGIHYFVFNLTGWDDTETARLLVERVMPELDGG